MTRQDARLARWADADEQAARIIEDAKARAWARVASRVVAPLTCDDALSTPSLGRPPVHVPVYPEAP